MRHDASQQQITELTAKLAELQADLVSWQELAEAANQRLTEWRDECGIWRDRALRAEQGDNVVPIRSVGPPLPAHLQRAIISNLNIPVYDPNRNLILDPIKQEPEA